MTALEDLDIDIGDSDVELENHALRPWSYDPNIGFQQPIIQRLVGEQNIGQFVRTRQIVVIRSVLQQLVETNQNDITNYVLHNLFDVSVKSINSASDSIFFTATFYPFGHATSQKNTSNTPSLFDMFLVEKLKSSGLKVFGKILPSSYSGALQEGALSEITTNMAIENITPHIMLTIFHTISDQIEHDIYDGSRESSGLPDNVIKGMNSLSYQMDLIKMAKKKEFTPSLLQLFEMGIGDSFYRYLEHIIKNTGNDSFDQNYNFNQEESMRVYHDKKHKQKILFEADVMHQLVKIFFQILYTLLAFENEGLTHYDLHLSNIWLQQVTPANQSLFYNPIFIYFVNDTEYVIVKYNENDRFVKLFDWGLSYSRHLHLSQTEERERNRRHCQQHGICASNVAGADIFKFFSLLYRHHIPDSLRRFMYTQFRNLHSHDYNDNLTLRFLQCVKANDSKLLTPPELQIGHICSSTNSLCEFDKEYTTSDGIIQHKCIGKYDMEKHRGLNSIEEIFRNFLKQFAMFFTVHKLPMFDKRFLPGTLRWTSSVYFVSNQVKSNVTTYLQNHEREIQHSVTRFEI